jgi:hypothetical protein
MDPRWHIAFCNVTITEYAGVPYRDYYSSPPLMLEAQLKAIDVAEREWGAGRFMRPQVDSPPATFASYLGMPVLQPDVDELPYIDSTRPLLTAAADADHLRLRDPRTASGLMGQRWAAWKYYSQLGYTVGFGGYEGSVITSAAEISSGRIFQDLALDPDAARRLLGRMVEANQVLEAFDRSLGSVAAGGYTGDDYAGLLSPAMFREFAIPCYERLYAGKQSRFMHSELLRAEHLRLARDLLGLTDFHGAGCKYLTLREMYDIMGNRFWTQLTPQEMQELSPAALAERIRELAGSGAAHVQLYPGRGTPPQNMAAAIAAVSRECPGGPAW